MRKILITNDDGINADGLLRLACAARTFGEVWGVAPESQRSAASHGITLHSPVDVKPCEFPAEGVRAFSCSGPPGDCLRVGALYVMDRKPDVVLSGINYGYNAASDIQYSGTCGAAFEASFQGCYGIALSEGACSCHEVTDRYLEELLHKWISQPLPRGQIRNINFPGCPLEKCRGILEDRIVSSGSFYRGRYRETETLPGGGVRLMVDGMYNEDAEPGTDFRALVDGYISVGIVRNVG